MEELIYLTRVNLQDRGIPADDWDDARVLNRLMIQVGHLHTNRHLMSALHRMQESRWPTLEFFFRLIDPGLSVYRQHCGWCPRNPLAAPVGEVHYMRSASVPITWDYDTPDLRMEIPSRETLTTNHGVPILDHRRQTVILPREQPPFQVLAAFVARCPLCRRGACFVAPTGERHHGAVSPETVVLVNYRAIQERIDRLSASPLWGEVRE